MSAYYCTTTDWFCCEHEPQPEPIPAIVIDRAATQRVIDTLDLTSIKAKLAAMRAEQE